VLRRIENRLLTGEVSRRDLIRLLVGVTYGTGFACFFGVMMHRAGDHWQGVLFALSSLGPLAAVYFAVRRYRRSNRPS